MNPFYFWMASCSFPAMDVWIKVANPSHREEGRNAEKMSVGVYEDLVLSQGRLGIFQRTRNLSCVSQTIMQHLLVCTMMGIACSPHDLTRPSPSVVPGIMTRGHDLKDIRLLVEGQEL